MIKKNRLKPWLFSLFTFVSCACGANGVAVPGLVDYITRDVPLSSLGSIDLAEQSVSGQYSVSWQISGANANYMLEEHLKGDDIDNWQPIYTGPMTSFMVEKTDNGQFKYRVKGCQDELCSYYLASHYINVDIPLATPENVNGVSSGGSHTIAWDPVARAESYRVEINFDGSGWQQLTTTTLTSVQYSPQISGSAMYRIQACDASGNDCSLWSQSTQALATTVDLVSVSDVSAVTSAGTHNISWQQVDNVSRYNIWININNTGWSYAIYTQDNHFSHVPLISGSYQYRIEACFSEGGSQDCATWSEVSNAVVNGTDASTPQNIIATNDQGVHTVSWTRVGDPLLHDVDYNLALSFNDSAWMPVTTLSATSFSHAPAISGNYRYRIQACYHFEGRELCDAWSLSSNTLVSTVATGTPQNLQASKNQDQHILVWDEVGDNSSHQFIYSLELSFNGSAFVYAAKTPSTNFAHTPGIAGSYRYRVKACFMLGESEHCGGWSDISASLVSTVKTGTPQNLMVNKSGEQHQLTWEQVGDPALHQVEYKLEVSLDEESWSAIGKTAALAFYNTPVVLGSYRYRVQACFLSDGLELCGNWSAASDSFAELGEESILIKTELLGAPVILGTN